MCGFTGIYSWGGAMVTPGDCARVREAQRRLRHRGPDAEGFAASPAFAVGFNRLALEALDDGSQPYVTADGRYTVAFNGEIYNYRSLAEEHGLQVRSEAELLSLLYAGIGARMFALLRGMFAMVVYDRERDELVCARDRFGVKPLYYRSTEGRVVFASELKGLPLPPEELRVDRRSMNLFCTFEYVPEPLTPYRGVAALPGGCCVRFSKEGTDMQCFAAKQVAPLSSLSRGLRRRNLREALEESVSLCMGGDTEVGTFLSGGVDSSVMAALATRANPHVKAFTVGFDCADYPSEAALARATADRLGIELVEETFGADDFKAAFDRTVYCLDAPMADPSAVGVYLLAGVASRHVRAVLSGEGADELFGGYKVYRSTAWTARFGAWQPAMDAILRLYAKCLPVTSALRGRIREHCYSLTNHYVGPTFVMNARDRKRLLLPGWYEDARPSAVTAPYLRSPHSTRLQRMQQCDWHLWLPCDILHKADRLSMAHSLEVRVPFLDSRVFEAAACLPDGDKVSARQTKLLLREACADLLPPETIGRPKLGFPVPVAAWLKDELYDWARGRLASPAAASFVNTAQALALLERHRTQGCREPHLFRQLWLLLCLVTWYGGKEA